MKNLGPWLLVATIGVAGAGMFFYAYFQPGVFRDQSLSDTALDPATGKTRHPSSVFSFFKAPQVLPELRFMNRKRHEISLEAFRGSFVLLNIWATWCTPCREEMPALDRLQNKLGGRDFHVLALSIDEAPPTVIKKFYDNFEIKSLFVYQDPTGKASAMLNLPGIPATFLIDRKGKGLGYVVGPVEWDSPEIVRELKNYFSPDDQ